MVVPNTTELGLFGRGRLGTEVARTAGLQLRWSTGRSSLHERLAPVDVVIDASIAEAVPHHLQWALENRTPLVIAATGWRIDELVTRVGGTIGLVVAPNGSPLIALFEQLAEQFGRFLAQQEQAVADCYLVEHHHANKRDAPSGTALRLADAYSNATSPPLPTPTSHSIRSGSELGLHRLGLDLPNESLEITHRVRHRRAFVDGLLIAAHWLHQTQKKGVFTMRQVLQDGQGAAHSPTTPHNQAISASPERN